MELPDDQKLNEMRQAIDSGDGLEDRYDQALVDIGIDDYDQKAVAKDFLEKLRELDRTFEAGDAAACVLLGCRKEARSSLEDADIPRKSAEALIALGLSLCGPQEDPHPRVEPKDWAKERDDEEDDEDDRGEEE